MKKLRKGTPENKGIGVLLMLRLWRWWCGLNTRDPKAAAAFYPFWLPIRRPGTFNVALYGCHLFNESKVKVVARTAYLEWWAQEYAEYPDYTLQVMQRIRLAIHHPQTKTEAVEIALLAGASFSPHVSDEKDDTIAARIEHAWNFKKHVGKAITGEDVKKARQALARKKIVRLKATLTVPKNSGPPRTTGKPGR